MKVGIGLLQQGRRILPGVDASPGLQERHDGDPPAVALSFTGSTDGLGFLCAARPVSENQRGPRQARQPAQPEGLRGVGGLLYVECALLVAREERSYTGPEAGGGGQRRRGVPALGGNL